MKGNKKHPPPPIEPPASAVAPTSAATSPPPAASPTRKGTAKYTNKDGSRFITVPKPLSSQLKTPAVQSVTPSPPPPSSPPPPNDTMDAFAKTSSGPTPPGGNRKKAKRRAKAAAAREKAELESVPAQSVQPDDGSASAPDSVLRPAHPPVSRETEGDGYSASDEVHPFAAGAAPAPDTAAGKAKKAKKKKKKKDAQHPSDGYATARIRTGEAASSKEKIWNTTSQEERQRIKEFWLDLSEEERKSLVKVEKDTVLKKMKEQQKLTCSCHFCGRKRTAIEEELEGLYDSYYEELEQFAHDPASHHGRGPPLMSSSAHFGSSRILHSPAPASTYAGQHPSRGQIIEHMGDGEDDDDDEYCEDDDDEDDDLAPEDDESDVDEEDIPPEELHRDYSSDFFNFGNSLQVHGGILTVADDLLKNDGRKFIEMMEQLAERRMAREEDAKDQYSNRAYISNGNGSAYGHNHHLPPEEDDYGVDEEEEEDYSQEEDYDEEEEAMTEEQRMEEGRRMFQIFAARMFEQRVLTAYREKVANERQRKLLEELADEETQEFQRKAKKAKDAQKRKDKLAQKKQALAEEKARKEAEKAAEEANRLAEENRKQEEQRRKAEEKRKKREAQRKAEEDERLRKELERQRRIHEQKERQAEQERKARDAKERERKLKEENRQREREAQQKKDHAVREQAEKLERDRRERDATKPRLGEAKEQRQKADNKSASKMATLLPTAVPTLPLIPAVPTPTAISAGTTPITLAKRPSQQQQQLNAVPVLPQQPTVPPPGFSSPQIPIATPALPKAPTPGRTRQLSQHGGSNVGSQNGTTSRTASLSGSSQSQNASPNPVTPVQTSPASFGHANAPSGIIHATPGIMQNLVSGASPMLSSIKPVSASQQQPTGSSLSMAPSPMPPLHYPLGMAPVTMPPGLGLSAPFAPMATGAYRASGQPPMTPIPQGISSLARSFSPMVAPPPGFGHHLPPVDQLGSASPVGPLSGAGASSSSTAHSRHPSAGFDHPGSSPGPASHLLGRPHPIGRPGSVVHGSQRQPPGSPMDNLAHSLGSDMDSSNPFHLGSKALLDGSDFPMDGFPARRSIGLPRSGGFGAVPGPFTVDFAPSPFASQASLWGASSLPAPSAMAAFASTVPQGFPVGSVSAGSWGMPLNAGHFPSHGGLGRTSSQAHSVTLRQILCRACKELSANATGMDTHGAADRANSSNEATPERDLIPIDAVKARVNTLAQNYIGPVQEAELDMLYDTEGNANNGGGNFDVQRNSEGKVTAICWVPDAVPSRYKLGIGGEAIISPAVGSSADFGTTPIGATPLRQ